MRLKIIILITFVLLPILFFGCNTKKVLVISLGGLSSTDIHDVVQETANEFGLLLTLNSNWYQDRGDGVAGNGDAERIRDNINALVAMNGGDKSNLSLLVVGKSAGGVLAWNTFKRHYGDIDDFHRVSLVLVDPHGAVLDDGQFGPYCKRQDLGWPEHWSSDTTVFRAYNIYQHESGLTGADFPDRRVFYNCQLMIDIDHDNITSHDCTRSFIYDALEFTFSGENSRRTRGCIGCAVVA